MTIYNPFDTFTNAAGNIERRPFPGNKIPKNMLNPMALKALSYLPAPQSAGSAFTNTNNWFGQGINISTSHQINIKGDHNFNEKTRLSGRYSSSTQQRERTRISSVTATRRYWTGGPNRTHTHSMVADYTHVFNANTLFNFRYGWTYSDFSRDPLVGYGFDVTSLGLPRTCVIPRRIRYSRALLPKDSRSSAQSRTGLWIDRKACITGPASMTKIIGGHNMKFGGEHRFNQLDYNQPGNPSGRFNFARRRLARA